MAHVERIQVVFADVDAMRHVNNAMYFRYFETARTHYYMRLAGLQRIEDVDFIVAKAACEFLRGLEFGERIEVVVWPTQIGTTSYTFTYALLDEQRQWAARGETVQVAFDYGAGKKKPIPPALRTALERERVLGSGLPPPNA